MYFEHVRFSLMGDGIHRIVEWDSYVHDCFVEIGREKISGKRLLL